MKYAEGLTAMGLTAKVVCGYLLSGPNVIPRETSKYCERKMFVL
jgi:hypothetical protein